MSVDRPVRYSENFSASFILDFLAIRNLSQDYLNFGCVFMCVFRNAKSSTLFLQSFVLWEVVCVDCFAFLNYIFFVVFLIM